MARLWLAKTLEHLPSQSPADSPRFTPSEIIPWLVGHSVKEVERELIIHTLAHHCGNRTLAASILGISIRSLRNKINEYRALGFAVPPPRKLMRFSIDRSATFEEAKTDFAMS